MMENTISGTPSTGLTFRERLTSLGFVKETDTGLDFWELPPGEPDECRAFGVGRIYAGQWLREMRHTGNAGMFYHLACAYRGFLERPSPTLSGLLYEFGLTISRTPVEPEHRVLLGRRLDFRAGHESRDARLLPWGPSPESGLPVWRPAPPGPPDEDRARGRHRGLAAVEFIRQTRSPRFLAAQPCVPSEPPEVEVGVFLSLGEALISSPAPVTCIQRAVEEASSGAGFGVFRGGRGSISGG